MGRFTCAGSAGLRWIARERRRDGQRGRDHQGRIRRIHLKHLLQEEECVELPAVPHHRLPRGCAEEGEQHELQARAIAERFLERRLRELALVLDLQERG